MAEPHQHHLLFVPLGSASYIAEHVHLVTTLADRLAHHLTLVGSVPLLGELPSAHLTDDDRSFLLDRVVSRLERLTQPWMAMTGRGCTTIIDVGVGSVSERTAQLCKANNVELVVVMASPGAGRNAALRRIVRVCSVPVLIVRPYTGSQQVLAAVDVTHPSGTNNGVLAGAQLICEHPDDVAVAKSAALFRRQPSLETEECLVFADETLEPDDRKRATQIEASIFDAHRDGLTQLTNLEQVVLEGQPAERITDFVELHHIGLVVLGSGSGPDVLGSVTDELINTLPTSVLITRSV